MFASSVVPGDNTDLHNALPGNNLYGVYGSFQDIVSKADFEPYVLWRVAPASSELPETLNSPWQKTEISRAVTRHAATER